MIKITFSKLQRKISLILLILIPIGFYTKFYHGPAQHWVNDNLSGVLYEIFWCLVIKWIFPRVRNIRLAIGVFSATTLLEFAQLWHPPFLEAIRLTFIGRTLIGNSFSWVDIPHYALGCLLGYIILKKLD